MERSTLMSAREAGERLGVCGRSVREWCRAGVIPERCWIQLPSGQFRIDFAALLEECRGNRLLGYRVQPQGRGAKR